MNDELPEPGSPLQLADGRTVDPRTGRVTRAEDYTVVPNNEQVKQIAARAQRKLVDLPDTPNRLNIFAIVSAYTLCGLADDEIAVALGVDAERVLRIRALDAFREFQNEIIAGIKQQDADTIRGIISQNAITAANRVRDLVNSDDDQVALSAAKDLLDRDGHRPADVVEHRHKFEDELVIRYIDDEDDVKLPGVVIDAE